MRTLNYLFGIVVILMFARCHKQELGSPAEKQALAKAMNALTITSYPSYNTSPLPPDQSGVASTAAQLAAKIRLGLNIGNTLEAIGGETAWGNPLVTQAYVDLAKKAVSTPFGFLAPGINIWPTAIQQSFSKYGSTGLNRLFSTALTKTCM
ncbi:hypothetical protein [Pedobacter panaciterrae]